MRFYPSYLTYNEQISQIMNTGFISSFWTPFLQNENGNYLDAMLSREKNMGQEPGRPGFDFDFIS